MAKIVGYGFLVAGILGFVPGITMNGYLLGIFHVNWLHNLIHLFTGGLLVWTAYKNECTAMKGFQFVTVAYGLVTLLGLIYYDRLMLGPLAMNAADTLLHLATVGIAVYYGFMVRMRRHVVCPT
jgi:hypothetical protein